MTALTRVQRTYLLREAIVAMIDELADDTGRQTESALDDLEEEARALACEDLEEARRVMEDDAAYARMIKEVRKEHPDWDRKKAANEVRYRLALPGVRHETAVAAGLYDHLKENTPS